MKFPYIPIASIIADVRAEMKTLNQQGDIIEGDCLAWAIECIREIGGNHYDKEPAIINIVNNNGKLPPNFYVADEVFLCERANSNVRKAGSIWFTDEEGIDYCPNQILFPGDAMTGSHYCTKNNRNYDREAPVYIIKHPNIIRTGFRTGKVGMIFLALPMNDRGEYMMQDEINSIKATKAFLMTKLLLDSYLMQQLPRAIYLDIKNEYDTYVDQAQAVFKVPDPADLAAKGYEQDHRYDDFKLR